MTTAAPVKLKAPFPYFGGKSKIAPVVWQAIGTDVRNYVEPFFGSGAVLLGRPEWTNRIETINELSPFVANFWRATKADPEAVAHHADWPVNEIDLHARHRWLVNQEDFKASMLADPDYYDAKIAGWWVWGISAWIGHGWCEGDNELSQQVPDVTGYQYGKGVHSLTVRNELSQQMPYLSKGHGQGVAALTMRTICQQLPFVGGDKGRHGSGIHGLSLRSTLVDTFIRLAERLRYVRVTCGDWSRVMKAALITKEYTSSVFLDPPYTTSSDMYGAKTNVSADVLEWCKANWENPKLRIVYCGYEGDLPVPEHWRKVAWKSAKGYQSKGNLNPARERLWLSPACLPLADEMRLI